MDPTPERAHSQRASSATSSKSTTTPTGFIESKSSVDSERPYSTFVTSMFEDHEREKASTEVSTSLATAPWPTMRVVSEADVPDSWRPKLLVEADRQFRNEMLFIVVFIGAGIVSIWILSAVTCWWKGECYWHPRPGDDAEQKETVAREVEQETQQEILEEGSSIELVNTTCSSPDSQDGNKHSVE